MKSSSRAEVSKAGKQIRDWLGNKVEKVQQRRKTRGANPSCSSELSRNKRSGIKTKTEDSWRNKWTLSVGGRESIVYVRRVAGSSSGLFASKISPGLWSTGWPLTSGIPGRRAHTDERKSGRGLKNSATIISRLRSPMRNIWCGYAEGFQES